LVTFSTGQLGQANFSLVNTAAHGPVLFLRYFRQDHKTCCVSVTLLLA